MSTKCCFISECRLSCPISSDIILCVNRFRVMVDFVRDPKKFKIL